VPRQDDPPPAAEIDPAEIHPAAEVHRPAGAHAATPGPWELPPTTGRPAEPQPPSHDDRTQLVPLVPVQHTPQPEAAPARPVAPPPGPSYPAPVAVEATAAGYRHEPVEYAPSSPAHDYPGPRDGDEHFGPVSAPQSDRGAGIPVSADPFSPVSGSPQSWQRSRVFGDPPPKPKRNLLLLGCVALVALLVGAAGGVAVTAARGGADPAPAPTQAAPLTPAQLLLPPAPPAAPGVEPPQGGGWPSSWPVFTSSESTRPMTGLEGLGFDFRVPPGWNCTKQGQAEAAVRYRCGAGQGDEATGGDLLVRTCEPPCGEPRRTELRRQEEAWGLRWTRSGPFTTWAETTEINGERLYGLVYVAFWRSTPEGEIDRQLVLRMTTPLATSDDLKKVANSIRDSTFTL
jgi:hypothetical protein